MTTDEADDRTSYRIDTDDDQVRQEHERLLTLARVRDPSTQRFLSEIGLATGWQCCDVGTGAGTVALWLAEQVGTSGRVVGLDVDTRFVPIDPGEVEFRQCDVTQEPIGHAEFDLLHARGVLQHLHQREEVLDQMVAAAKPGGWIVVTDSDWIQFAEQPVPEPFASLSRLLLESSATQHGHDANWGRRMIAAFQERGLTEVHAEGDIWTMHGGTDSTEWLVAGLARALEYHHSVGTLPEDFPADEAIAQARDPSFAILSPISITVRGRRPA